MASQPVFFEPSTCPFHVLWTTCISPLSTGSHPLVSQYLPGRGEDVPVALRVEARVAGCPWRGTWPDQEAESGRCEFAGSASCPGTAQAAEGSRPNSQGWNAALSSVKGMAACSQPVVQVGEGGWSRGEGLCAGSRPASRQGRGPPRAFVLGGEAGLVRSHSVPRGSWGSRFPCEQHSSGRVEDGPGRGSPGDDEGTLTLP